MKDDEKKATSNLSLLRQRAGLSKLRQSDMFDSASGVPQPLGSMRNDTALLTAIDATLGEPKTALIQVFVIVEGGIARDIYATHPGAIAVTVIDYDDEAEENPHICQKHVTPLSDGDALRDIPEEVFPR